MAEAKTNTKESIMRDMKSKLLPLFRFSKGEVGEDAMGTKLEKTKIALEMKRGSELPLNAMVFLLLRLVLQKQVGLGFREEKSKRGEGGYQVSKAYR